MRQLFVLVAFYVLTGCGADTATSAATGAAIKQQEITQGERTRERAQQKIDAAVEAMQQRAQQAGGTESR